MPESRERSMQYIEASAKLDAGEYINLMKRISPESLKPPRNINLSAGEKFFEERFQALGLTEKNVLEKTIYLFVLKSRIDEMLDSST